MMSQPPQPIPYPQPDAGYSPQYGFMPYYMTPPEALLGPARRASWMLFTLAALLLLGTTCFGVVALTATESMLAESLEEMRRTNPEAAAMYTTQVLRTGWSVMAIVLGLMAVVATILGVVVRSGSRPATITALVLVLLPSLIIVLLVLSSLMFGLSAFLSALLVMVLPLVLMAMTISFLAGAIRAAPQVEAARQQLLIAHQQQHAQYMAQYQAYQQQSQQQSQQSWPNQPPQA